MMKMSKQKKLMAMIGSVSVAFAVPTLAQRTVNNVQDYLGPRVHSTDQNAASLQTTPRALSAADFVRHWNQIAVDASGLDHTPVAAGETRVFGEQL